MSFVAVEIMSLIYNWLGPREFMVDLILVATVERKFYRDEILQGCLYFQCFSLFGVTLKSSGHEPYIPNVYRKLMVL